MSTLLLNHMCTEYSARAHLDHGHEPLDEVVLRLLQLVLQRLQRGLQHGAAPFHVTHRLFQRQLLALHRHSRLDNEKMCSQNTNTHVIRGVGTQISNHLPQSKHPQETTTSCSSGSFLLCIPTEALRTAAVAAGTLALHPH